ncbi:MAG: hypothetical protein U9N10_10880, partial [Bacillota bacterium]|nr:hypothetical protein [Bacillota bacterium]
MIKERNLNKFELDDYIEIQRLFIENEIKCYKECRSKEKAIIDLGPEEIEFYTINFPKSINKEWDIETVLHAELNELRM